VTVASELTATPTRLAFEDLAPPLVLPPRGWWREVEIQAGKVEHSVRQAVWSRRLLI
jgi:hypothetical protein